MKTTYLFIALLLSAGQVMAQRTIHVMNVATTDVNFVIRYIESRDATTADGYPHFVSNPSVETTVPPNTTYTLTATSPSGSNAFPLYSPGSSPVIDYWTRISSPSGASTTHPSIAVTPYGGAQILYNLVHRIIDVDGHPLNSITDLIPTAANSYSDSYSYGTNGGVFLSIVNSANSPAPDGETWVFIY